MNDPLYLSLRLRAHASHNLEVRAMAGEAFVDCLDCDTAVVVVPVEYADTYKKWRPHDGHEGEICLYGPEDAPVDITVECCDTVLVSAESDGEFMCPRCGETFCGTDYLNQRYIIDHSSCEFCMKRDNGTE